MADKIILPYFVLIIVLTITAMCATFYHIGANQYKREAVRFGHAYWSCDEDGNTEFKWKNIN